MAVADWLLLGQVLGHGAGAAAPAGDHPRDERHGEGAPGHVLQVHRGIQATQDHPLQVPNHILSTSIRFRYRTSWILLHYLRVKDFQ